ncbi:hypothetical protein [Paenibacillus odorifer]|uniref:hypothetical protein n=1 Tax=Paenibacillus odorifer TaxID=189426 RepID=UPI00096D718E|nr:hypothetical protein [Paenibacillus odorifer]OME19936.1 hypothetical protein BSK57_23495 [Paenibacillus odorifer]
MLEVEPLGKMSDLKSRNTIVKKTGKELEVPNVKLSNLREDREFAITTQEYEEMLKLNDIIERLKRLTTSTFANNKVHDGWAIFSDSLVEYWQRGHYPFYDGLNRKNYEEFIISLDAACELIGIIADPDYYGKQNTSIKMWNEEIPVSIQPAINNRYVETVGDAKMKLDVALGGWKILKDGITHRYEKERSEQ